MLKIFTKPVVVPPKNQEREFFVAGSFRNEHTPLGFGFWSGTVTEIDADPDTEAWIDEVEKFLTEDIGAQFGILWWRELVVPPKGDDQ